MISKKTQHNMYVIIKRTILIMWQRVALITLAAVRRVLRETYFFRLNCCKDLCREALQLFSEGTKLVGDVFLSNSLTLTVHCPCPFSLHTKMADKSSWSPCKVEETTKTVVFQTSKTLEHSGACNIVAEGGFRWCEVLLFVSSYTCHLGETGRQGLVSPTWCELQCLEPGFVHGHSWPRLQAAPKFLGAVSAVYKAIEGTF